MIALHGDNFDLTLSHQYAFAPALTQGFDAPAMRDRVRARLGAHPDVNDVVAAGFLRPGYTDNAGDRSDGERGRRAATITRLKWWTPWRPPAEP